MDHIIVVSKLEVSGAQLRHASFLRRPEVRCTRLHWVLYRVRRPTSTNDGRLLAAACVNAIMLAVGRCHAVMQTLVQVPAAVRQSVSPVVLHPAGAALPRLTPAARFAAHVRAAMTDVQLRVRQSPP